MNPVVTNIEDLKKAHEVLGDLMAPLYAGDIRFCSRTVCSDAWDSFKQISIALGIPVEEGNGVRFRPSIVLEHIRELRASIRAGIAGHYAAIEEQKKVREMLQNIFTWSQGSGRSGTFGGV